MSCIEHCAKATSAADPIREWVTAHPETIHPVDAAKSNSGIGLASRIGLPVTLCRYGNETPLTKAPKLPNMFIAAETLPAFLPAISAQKTQLGPTVMSTPKAASVKQTTAAPGVPARNQSSQTTDQTSPSPPNIWNESRHCHRASIQASKGNESAAPNRDPENKMPLARR